MNADQIVEARATSHPRKDEENETPGDAFDFEEGLHGSKKSK